MKASGKSRAIGSLAAALAFLSTGWAATESRVLFREGFDSTADRPFGFTEPCSINEMPPSLKSLAFRPLNNKAADVYQGGLFLLPAGSRGCSHYEFQFRFLFPNGSKNALTLSLVSGSSEDQKSQSTVSVTLSDKVMGIRSPDASRLPPFGGNAQELNLRPMAPNLWHQARVRVCGQTVELFVENDGVMRKVAQAERKPAPLAGFNFSGSTPFDLDDIVIRRLDPPDDVDFKEESGRLVATRAAVYRLEVPAQATAVSTRFQVGVCPGAMQIALGYADGTQRVVDVKTFSASYNKNVLRNVNELNNEGKLTATNKWLREAVPLPDAGLLFRERMSSPATKGWSLALNIKPNLYFRYLPEQELAIVSQWDRFSAASTSFIKFELRPDASGAGIWVDGRYAGRFDSTARVTSVAFTVPAGGSIRDSTVSREPVSTRYLPLDVASIANPGNMKDAVLSGVEPGRDTVGGIPFIVVDGPGNADTGVCREGLGTAYLECDGYLSRTPFDGMPESLMISVPVASYYRAWALCAVEEDPDKVTVITARLTKFLPNSDAGRGYAFADTEVTLSRLGEPLPANVKKAGSVKTGGKTLPLYLVEFKMDVGNIQEILYREKPAWLDFEVLGKRSDKDNYYFDRSRKPADEISGVHVFGATLERSPVEMVILPKAFGNFYRPGEKPAMTATLSAVEKSACTLAWSVRDIGGRVLEKGTRDIVFDRPGLEQAVEIPFSATDLGWYGVDYTLSAREGQELLRHTAFFALIDKDTRKAGYESPYFAWNFGGPHGTITNIAQVGELLLNAGIRNTQVASEKVGEPWKLTMGQLPYIRSRSKDPAEADQELEKLIKASLEKYPHATMALIFHESGGGPYPLELLGGKTEVDAKQSEYDKAKTAGALALAKAYRKWAPQIRLVIGNSGSVTPGLLASLFRGGFPREYLDFMGEETVGMTIPPELSVGKANWILRETARVFGYGEVPVSACFEWKCRRSRHLGLLRFAEWNARDILIGLAWRQPLVPTVGLPDVGSSYYNSVWGDEAFTPYPQVYPKPSYAAVSTATRVLDCVRFVRMIPTGSRTVYALEFTRGDEFVYAFWTARGELDLTLALEKDSPCRLTELLGRSTAVKSVSGALTLHVGEGAQYLTSPVAVKGVTGLGERHFPREQPPAGAAVVVANALDKPGEWQVDSAIDPRLDVPAKAPVTSDSFRRPGVYELRAATDEEKGPCLELELIQTNDCPALMQEYTFLKLRQPVDLSGRPGTIGMWVRGNSSWGKLFWEVEDADGERWLSAGSGGYGCDAYDWQEQAGLNFDGWNFIQFPITSLSPIKINAPGQDGYQWQYKGVGNRRLDYPLKITGVAVSMPRQALNLLEMERVRTVIRMKDLSVY